MHRRTQVATTVLAVLGALATLVITTQVFPYHSLNHDEAVYIQQASMLLEGQLNLWPPVDGAFQPWFFVEDGPRLYPKYAPVPAAMFALGKLFGSFRIALLGIAAGNLALVVGVVREVFDARTGLLAAVFVLCSPLFLLQSSVFLPYAPTTLLNLTFAYAYLRADRTGSRRWAAIGGGAVGLAFFARPYTAVLFAAPFIGHALWTLWSDWDRSFGRQATTASLGFGGVAVALGYNALITGSPLRFPYQAFAPEDGPGFGHREILTHEVDYTVELAVRANRKVVELFFSEWIAGGVLGALLAGLGVAYALRSERSARVFALVGLFPSVVVGNVYFWGNFNILGALGEAGDGLVSVLGPYYHFDLLVPTAAFAAVGAVAAGERLHSFVGARLDRRAAHATLAVVAIVALAGVGTVTAGDLGERVEENMDATETYEDAYEPFEGGPPANSLILLPRPYGDWLNHPFQVLRNDPGFDGRAVYALNDHPFAVADEFPDRRLYRYVYRGAWAPYAGSPDAALLQRVRDVSGARVRLDTTVGVPDGAVGVTARVSTDEGNAYYVVRNVSDTLDLRLTVSDGEVRIVGDGSRASDPVAIEGRDDIRLTIFVDYGLSGGFTYRFDLPVDASGERVRALSPRLEWCRNARACGGAAAYVPEEVPDGVFVRTDLAASNSSERNP